MHKILHKGKGKKARLYTNQTKVLKMIEIGQISINENDVEYANNQITLKVNNGEFQKGSIALTNQ